jgi:ADP-ribose pyrophosphatase YjhB (NUDIX family)
MPTDHPPFRFCPVCAARLELRGLKAGDPERLACPACGYVHYVDPKVAVGTIVAGAAERVLLLRRAIEPGYGKWVFPGGYVDRGEIVERAALREAREECGLEVRLGGLVGIYSYAGRTPIVIVYSAAAVEAGAPAACTDEESLEARWFAPADIPWADLAFPSTQDALRDYLEGRIYRR